MSTSGTAALLYLISMILFGEVLALLPFVRGWRPWARFVCAVPLVMATSFLVGRFYLTASSRREVGLATQEIWLYIADKTSVPPDRLRTVFLGIAIGGTIVLVLYVAHIVAQSKSPAPEKVQDAKALHV